MNKHTQYRAIIIVPLLFSLISSIQREVDINTIRRRMNNALDTISAGVENHELFKIMRSSYEFDNMRRVVDISKNSTDIIFSSEIEYSTSFLTSLYYDTEAFENFVNFFKIGRIPLSTYFNVLNASVDLDIKAKVIKTSNTDTVKVTVNTLGQQGKEIHHCIVWYVYFVKDYDTLKRKFDRFSTPTTDYMPAGLWKIWTEKNGKMGPKSPFDCGGDGRPEREIDISAPRVNGNDS